MNSEEFPVTTVTSTEPGSLSDIINMLEIPDQPDQQQQSTISVQDIPAVTDEELIYILNIPTQPVEVPPNPTQPTQPAAVEPHLVILEQPASNMRFRYESDGGSKGAGVMQGANSTAEKRTFPKIQLRGFTGKAFVVVSCVTHDSENPKAHPHKLVSPARGGTNNCKNGVCTAQVISPDMTFEFRHLGIQCMKRNDLKKALEERKSIRVDPYQQGFEHSKNPAKIDLNAVKLCFQAFLESPEKPGKYASVIPKVCSETIFNRRNELQITDMSSDKASAKGGKKLIILCEKIKKEDDIKVRFFQENTGWEAFGGKNTVYSIPEILF